ncbi:MAG TPA: hypothetical protein EYG03_15930 [Planctomycetes bacterium]|nr:hypothetical protein [Planctomycetota bacterium]
MNRLYTSLSVVAFALSVFVFSNDAQAELRVGAAVTNVTPPQFPVFVNGGMLTRSANAVNTPVNARSLVIESGNSRIALVVVDSCMIPRQLCDEAKQLAAQRTKLRPDQIMISATHTHTAPSCMGALGTDADPTYVPFLREKLAEAIAAAEKNLQPAEVGWGSTQAGSFTALRRWIRRPDRLVNDPFGNPTVRATMHAGADWDNVTGQSGPEDPQLSMIAFRSKTGRPLALLANFSMHYFGDKPLSADYYGLFCEGFKGRIAAENGLPVDSKEAPFVGIMSHGCSGDIWKRDYAIPADKRVEPGIDEYTAGLLDLGMSAYRKITYRDEADVEMAERRMTLNYRVPDQQRLEWAEGIIKSMGDKGPTTQQEVYALEQIILHERQSTVIVIQALRIGDICIATTPNETYALTGLKIKLQSPLLKTMVIELANGGDGYIPPPEQHLLGGYNTWAARSAGLEVQAEPKIVETALQLLEQVVGQRRRKVPSSIRADDAALSARPIAFWRMDDLAGPLAADASGNDRNGHFEDGVVFFLPGVAATDDNQTWPGNRAAHFAGGRLAARFSQLGDQYSVALWCWNGLPLNARDITGWLVSRDHKHGTSNFGDHLGLTGGEAPGRLVFRYGKGAADDRIVGKTQLERWQWYHVTLVRNKEEVTVYLNGKSEIAARVSRTSIIPEMFIGGRSDNQSNWEGRIDEVAVFDRVLTPNEIKQISQK